MEFLACALTLHQNTDLKMSLLHLFQVFKVCYLETGGVCQNIEVPTFSEIFGWISSNIGEGISCWFVSASSDDFIGPLGCSDTTTDRIALRFLQGAPFGEREAFLFCNFDSQRLATEWKSRYLKQCIRDVVLGKRQARA